MRDILEDAPKASNNSTEDSSSGSSSSDSAESPVFATGQEACDEAFQVTHLAVYFQPDMHSSKDMFIKRVRARVVMPVCCPYEYLYVLVCSYARLG